MAKAPTSPDIQKRIGQFVALRDKIKLMDDAHKTTMKPAREALEQLGNMLMDHLKNINADSVATEAGTVYKTVKHSASIADGEAFWKYVTDNEAWDLLDRKANVSAVADFIETHSGTPPGINYTSVQVVGVRRK